MIAPLLRPPKGRGGPTLLLLHGFAQGPQSFLPLLDALADHGEARAPPLPGHGGTPAPDGTFEAAARALGELAPRGGVILGYSLGARLGLTAGLLARPGHATAVVALSGHLGLLDPAERAARAAEDEARAAALERVGLAAFLDEWEALPLFATQARLPAALLRAQRELRASHDPAGLAAAFRRLGLAHMPDLRAALRETTTPVRLVTGALDPRFTALAGAAARPPAVLHDVVADAGHNLLLEAPAALARLLKETLTWPT